MKWKLLTDIWVAVLLCWLYFFIIRIFNCQPISPAHWSKNTKLRPTITKPAATKQFESWGLLPPHKTHSFILHYIQARMLMILKSSYCTEIFWLLKPQPLSTLSLNHSMTAWSLHRCMLFLCSFFECFIYLLLMYWLLQLICELKYTKTSTWALQKNAAPYSKMSSPTVNCCIILISVSWCICNNSLTKTER